MGSSIGFQTPTRQEWHLTSTHSLRLPSKRSLDKKKSSRVQDEVCRGSADDDHDGLLHHGSYQGFHKTDWRMQMDDAVQGMLYSLRTRGTSAGSQRQFLQCLSTLLRHHFE